MKGDFTRDTFDASNHFTRVLMQQGRAQLDADLNEQTAILLHYLQTLAVDLGGRYWGPDGEDLGFEISSIENDSGNFTIGRGHYYVDGLLVENENPLKYRDQNGFAAFSLPESEKSYYVYLDVWERHLTYVQDDRIRETALGMGGPDTCTRAQVVWQVRLDEVPTDSRSNCEGTEYWINSKTMTSQVTVKARLQSEHSDTNACIIPPDSHYRGAENQLYRIEVHRYGVAWDGSRDRNGVPTGNAMEAATFKWSRDNGSVIFPILRQQGSMATLQSLGHDTDTGLKVGDWVEIMDDGLELRGEPGILAQVESIDPFEMNVTLQLPDDVNVDDPKFSWPSYDEQSTNHPLLRRWDYHAIDGIAMSQGAILISENSETDEGWIEIEDGIEAQFQLSDGEMYRTGDYWLIPARVATGRIEWPTTTDVDDNEVPIALAPHGIEHHYAPLGVIVDRQVQDKCRCRLPLTAIVCNDPGSGQG